MAVYPDWKSYPPKDAASYKGNDLDPDADGKIDHADLENVTTAQHHDPANQVEGESAGLREEHGEATVTEPAAPADATWDTNNANYTDVSFATAFSTTPYVTMHPSAYAGAGECVGGLGDARANANYTTGGFRVYELHYGTGAGGDANVPWIAIGS